jgi:DNA topoisomerase-1
VSATRVRFRFRGKSGKVHDVDVEDRRIARLVRAVQDLPGQELFQYVGDDGEVKPIGSTDVNDYLREVGGESFTAKDFRTWAGTVAAARALADLPAPTSRAAEKQLVADAVKRVAEQLGTAGVCRKCYVHPTIIEAFVEGTTLRTMPSPANGRRRGLDADEVRVVAMLSRPEQRLRAAGNA